MDVEARRMCARMAPNLLPPFHRTVLFSPGQPGDLQFFIKKNKFMHSDSYCVGCVEKYSLHTIVVVQECCCETECCSASSNKVISVPRGHLPWTRLPLGFLPGTCLPVRWSDCSKWLHTTTSHPAFKKRDDSHSSSAPPQSCRFR